MRLKSTLMFMLQASIAGLAVAFVILLWRPELLRHEPVEIRESPAAMPALARSASGPYSYAAAVQKAVPAVVNINTAKVVAVQPNPFADDPVLRQFFGRNLDDLIRPRQEVETSLGSGVIVSQQGYILTNHHVIQGADAIQVSLRDGRVAQATVVGSDPDTDIAVLKINLKDIPAITLGQSERVQVGDVALAIGNPFGVGQTVTMGIVSATGLTKLGINVFENFIQTDAAINPGNSGGALVDAEGNLIGINTAILSRSGGFQGIGFAIPTSLAKSVLEDIIQHGRPLRSWLGIEAQGLTPEIERALDLKNASGVIVTGVIRNGPAHKAGLQPGDIITAIDGKKITDARDAMIAILGRRPGTGVTLTVWREGKTQTVQATTIEQPPRRGRGR
jgi:Do/DeqQ family serine protease